MKKFPLLALAGLCSMGLLAACGDDSPSEPEPTKAEQCANGLSKDCLVGTWSANGLVSITQVPDPLTGVVPVVMHATYNYTAVPGTLKFESAGTFVYEGPAGTGIASCLDGDGGAMYGTWSIVDNTLKLSAKNAHNIASLCVQPTNQVVLPVITVDGGVVTMNFMAASMDKGVIWFLGNEGIAESVPNYYAEMFTIK